MGQWDELLAAVNSPDQIVRNSDPVPLLRKILGALADRRVPTKTSIKKFDELVKLNAQLLTLKYDGKSFEWTLKSGRSANVRDARIIRAMEDLLIHEKLTRLKRCEGEGCTVLFVDESKNQSRRWCAMEHCGMLLKSKRYYDAHRRRK